MAKYADVLQIGARNMQNFSLLHAAGESQHPVLLKRGNSATIEELLMAAEYILSHGNRRVILCERGIRTFETSTRNTTDINAIPVLKALTHLPVILDPSHTTGHWEYVLPIARAGIAAGADGLIVEVHPNPDEAMSDGGQSLKPERFAELVTPGARNRPRCWAAKPCTIDFMDYVLTSEHTGESHYDDYYEYRSHPGHRSMRSSRASKPMASRPTLSQGEERTVIGVVGNNPHQDPRAVHLYARRRPDRADLAAVQDGLARVHPGEHGLPAGWRSDRRR